MGSMNSTWNSMVQKKVLSLLILLCPHHVLYFCNWFDGYDLSLSPSLPMWVHGNIDLCE
jgi:hypothetical protein